MYKLWFKVKGEDGEHSVDCQSVVAAQIVWDTLNSNPLIILICTRP